jgi:hypothetical protein
MPEPLLEGESKILSAFGYFPTFHDAEIVVICLNRNSTPELAYPTVSIEFTLHGWELTSEITSTGHYRLSKHHLVRFRFDGVDEVDLRDFNHQNVLFELKIFEIDSPGARLKVEFGSSYGLEGGFVAFSGAVLDVIPCDEYANPIPKNG